MESLKISLHLILLQSFTIFHYSLTTRNNSQRILILSELLIYWIFSRKIRLCFSKDIRLHYRSAQTGFVTLGDSWMEGPNLAQKPTGSWVYTGARHGVLPPFCSQDDSSPDSSSSFSYPCTYVGAPRTYANSRYSSASTYISAHCRAEIARFNGKHWSCAVSNRHDAAPSSRLSSARASFRCRYSRQRIN